MSKNDFNATINLPKTDFPMRAGLAKREPDMLRRWNDMDLYNEMLKKNDGKPRFSLHDGPPFSNGNIHMGHALNKALKDFIVRSYAMRGYYTPYIPGWDNHGMPIESAIIKQNKLNHKAMSVSEFRSACHEFADHYIDVQRDGFKRMGVVDRNILRIAAWEIMFNDDVPNMVAIDEALSLAKTLCDDDSPAFIHGLLSAVSADAEATEVAEQPTEPSAE